MRKAPFLPLLFLSIFIAGCDNGSLIKSQGVPSKLKVLVERQTEVVKNGRLVVYAMDFHKEGRILTFVCPCYIASDFNESFLTVQVEGNTYKTLQLTLLPDAEYKVEVTYWTPNSDNNTKVQFRISQ